MTERDPPDNLNLNGLTFQAYDAIRRLDETFIDTDNYMGIAWFWNYHYRHYLRDVSRFRRRLVHKKLREAGLDVSAKSPAVTEIVERWYK